MTPYDLGYADGSEHYAPLEQADVALQFGGSISGANPLYDEYYKGFNAGYRKALGSHNGGDIVNA